MLEKMKINLKHRRVTSLKRFKEMWIVNNTNILINILIRKTKNIFLITLYPVPDTFISHF